MAFVSASVFRQSVKDLFMTTCNCRCRPRETGDPDWLVAAFVLVGPFLIYGGFIYWGTMIHQYWCGSEHKNASPPAASAKP